MYKYKITILLLAVYVVQCHSAGFSRVSVLLLQEGAFVYYDGTRQTGATLYEKLAKPMAEAGRKQEVVVLFDANLPFTEISNAKGVIQAVGFSAIRFFYLSSDRAKMAEVSLGFPAVLVPPEFQSWLGGP